MSNAISAFSPSPLALEDLNAALMAGKVPEQDVSFATDLVTKGNIRGLTEPQWRWVGILLRRMSSAAPMKVKGGFSKLYDLFQTASEHLKYPKIVLQLPNGAPVQFYRSGERSKMPGVVNITDGGHYGNNIWYGRVLRDGTFLHSRTLTDAELAPVRRLLGRLVKDPAAVAAEYGKLTSSCCFCNRRLTDARSATIGFGLTCATNYGLKSKWGSKTVKDALGV